MATIVDKLRDKLAGTFRDLQHEVQGWLRIIRYKRVPLVLSGIALGSLAVALRPIPPHTTTIASGQAGSVYDRWSRGLATRLAGQGLKLKLVPTSGQVEGFEHLGDDRSEVNVSFITAGTFTSKDDPTLESLGSVGLATIMLIHSGDALAGDDPFAALGKKKIAIGPEGSVSNRLFRIVEGLNRTTGQPRGEWVQLPNAEAATKLLAREIDAMFLADAFESETAQRLLADPSLRLHDFTLADAYAKKLPFLQTVVVPKGSIDLDRIRPDRDVTLLASTIDLLVEKGTHPAVQWALLIAAQEAAFNDKSFFTESRGFPRHADGSFPSSSVARRFYSSGVPGYFDSLPLWLATLLNQIWVYLVAFFLVVNPLLERLNGLRSFNSGTHLDYFYNSLRDFDLRVKTSKDPDELRDIIARADKIAALVDATWFDDKDTRSAFALESSIEKVRRRAEERLATLTGKPA